jgi:uncharacterized membrane protein
MQSKTPDKPDEQRLRRMTLVALLHYVIGIVTAATMVVGLCIARLAAAFVGPNYCSMSLSPITPNQLLKSFASTAPFIRCRS